MSENDPGSVQEMAEEIRGYLERHPAAADTLEGILAWWLARQRYQQYAERIARALEYLVKIGEIKMVRTADDRCIYTRNNRI